MALTNRARHPLLLLAAGVFAWIALASPTAHARQPYRLDFWFVVDGDGSLRCTTPLAEAVEASPDDPNAAFEGSWTNLRSNAIGKGYLVHHASPRRRGVIFGWYCEFAPEAHYALNATAPADAPWTNADLHDAMLDYLRWASEYRHRGDPDGAIHFEVDNDRLWPLTVQAVETGAGPWVWIDWPVLVLDLLSVGACLLTGWIILRGIAKDVRRARRRSRATRGLCPRCGYPAAWSPSTPRCPECGESRP